MESFIQSWKQAMKSAASPFESVALTRRWVIRGDAERHVPYYFALQTVSWGQVGWTLLNQKDKELGREDEGVPRPGGQENIVV